MSQGTACFVESADELDKRLHMLKNDKTLQVDFNNYLMRSMRLEEGETTRAKKTRGSR